jgi:virulence factor Mce-like protein
VRRLAASAAVAVAAIVAAAGALGATDTDPQTPSYRVVLDNAFGLIEGADLKVAGVRAGRVERLDVRPSDLRAVVTVKLSRPGFGPFRSDVFCEVRPQSLIGEYFLDCQPGRFGRPLAPGATIPVSRTATTIPSDLVANVLRRPHRERLRLILNELGVAVAARGPELNASIRRAVPALRDTNRVLAVLDANREVLAQLTRDADRVLVRLAANRRNVSRFVAEARDTAAVSASRRVSLQATLRRLPVFLRELRPTLRDLGRAAAAGTPALRDLRASAPRLTTLLTLLGPFSNAARPALETLGDASLTGRRAVGPARETVEELRRFTEPTPELARNLAIVLEDLDDRDRAVEPDPDSPGGRGYTGLEALLQYPFDQVMAINTFDKRGYVLKLNLILNECGSYTDADHAASDPARTRECGQDLGPTQPGVNDPDPSSSGLAARDPGAPDTATPSPLALDAASATATPPEAPASAGAAPDGLLDFLLAR